VSFGVTCPDTKALPLPSNAALTDACAGGGIFTSANLDGAADVLTVYNGDQN
jgi:hypothetical protein